MKLYLLYLLFALSASVDALAISSCPPGFAELFDGKPHADLSEIKTLPWDQPSIAHEVPATEFQGLTKPPSSDDMNGSNHTALYFAKYKNEDAFLKVSFAGSKTVGAYKNFVKEANWTKRLDDLGIGPKFFGTTQLPEGFSIATAPIQGKHVSDLAEFEASRALVNQNTLKDLERIRDTLRANGIVPMDFQFRIDQQGHVWVIDPAFYLQKGEDVPKDFPMDGINAVEKFIQAIKNK